MNLADIPAEPFMSFTFDDLIAWFISLAFA